MQTVRQHLEAKISKFGHVAVCLVYEVLVISLWLVCAVYFQWLGDLAQAKGAPAMCVSAFKWVSSITLLSITISHLLHDVGHTMSDSYETVKAAIATRKGKDTHDHANPR